MKKLNSDLSTISNSLLHYTSIKCAINSVYICWTYHKSIRGPVVLEHSVTNTQYNIKTLHINQRTTPHLDTWKKAQEMTHVTVDAAYYTAQTYHIHTPSTVRRINPRLVLSNATTDLKACFFFACVSNYSRRNAKFVFWFHTRRHQHCCQNELHPGLQCTGFKYRISTEIINNSFGS